MNKEERINYNKIKNHQDMKDHLIKYCPQLCYNDTFVNILADVEMEKLVNERLKSIEKNKNYSA